MIVYICNLPLKKKLVHLGGIIKINNFKTEIFTNSKNIEIQFCDYKNIPLNTNCIYLFIKHIPDYVIPIIEKLKTNNYLIYEILDTSWYLKLTINNYINYLIPRFNLFHHVILNNKSFLKNKIIQKLQINKSVIYHEYDQRLIKKDDIIQKKIIYIGSLKKSSFNQDYIIKYNIDIITITKPEHFYLNLKGIHIDYVKPNKLYYYIHTATKLSTCLALDSIFISNRIPVFVELLGKKYDLFFKDDLSDLHQIINKAYDILQNTNKYLDYLKKMAPIKKRLSLHNTSKQYYDIFKSI